MNRVVIYSFFSCLFAPLLFSCVARELGSDAKLEIKTMTLNGKSIEPGHEIEVRDVWEIGNSDIKATFAYANIEGEVELPLYMKNAPIALKKDVPIRVEVYVLAKRGEYQGWQGSFNAILK